MIVLIVMMGADPNVLFGEERGCYRTSLEFFLLMLAFPAHVG